MVGNKFHGKLAAILACSLLVLFHSQAARAGEKVLFYMHGSDAHHRDADSNRVRRYKKIVAHLEGKGLVVIFEHRPKADAEQEAARMAKMVNDRIAAGTAAEDIIVGGFSYGAMIALKTAGILSNDKVNYALFCGCPENPSVKLNIDFAAVKGRMLSIIDEDDAKFGSCKGRLPNVADFTEKTINSGKGHKVFKMSKGKFLKFWVPHLTAWAGAV